MEKFAELRRFLTSTSPLATLLVSLVGCGSSAPAEDPSAMQRVVAPASAEEKQVLQAVPSLPSNKETIVGSYSVVAQEAYLAASGRECRWLHLARSGGAAANDDRLVCKDAEGWFFAPPVYPSPPPKATP